MVYLCEPKRNSIICSYRPSGGNLYFVSEGSETENNDKQENSLKKSEISNSSDPSEVDKGTKKKSSADLLKDSISLTAKKHIDSYHKCGYY